MPTYEYQCPERHEFELFQKMSEKPRAKCPVCGKPAMRKISGGAGLVFKGSGFYITDYGKDGKGPRQDPSEKADAGAAKDSKPAAESKTDSPAKSDTKSSDKRSEAKPDKQAPAKSSKKAAPE
jgi:putative FmdB family regulatory protein